MANIRSLQMADAVCADARVRLEKRFLGLSVRAVYAPTGSPLRCKTLELTAEDGKRMHNILTLSREQMLSALADLKLCSVYNGNYVLELAASEDARFVALQLFHYVQLGYEPVTDVLFLEGDEARHMAQL